MPRIGWFSADPRGGYGDSYVFHTVNLSSVFSEFAASASFYVLATAKNFLQGELL